VPVTTTSPTAVADPGAGLDWADAAPASPRRTRTLVETRTVFNDDMNEAPRWTPNAPPSPSSGEIRDTRVTLCPNLRQIDTFALQSDHLPSTDYSQLNLPKNNAAVPPAFGGGWSLDALAACAGPPAPLNERLNL
jgi:hypothetical protein